MKKFFFLLGLGYSLLHTAVMAQTVPAGFSVTTIASGWAAPVGAVFTNDGQQLFVWEKGGKVFVCKRNASTGVYEKQATPVLDISPEVGNWRDHGLLGFALDPNYTSNGLIYLLYVVDRHHLLYFGTGSYNAATNEYFNATIGRVTRYQTSTNASQEVIANTASRAVLLGESASTGIPILYESHSVGGLAFAADGTLLISGGDGASYSTTDPGNISHTYFSQALIDDIIRDEENVGSFRSQLLNCHGGKLLRIDPANGNGIGSNPFYSAAQPRSARSRVWALGFRNPFRIAVRPGTGSTNPTAGDIGEVYVGDVGWNVWEELNIITGPGMNCGWPLFEGHTTLNSYYNLTTANPDEPNPLNGTGGCTQELFTFKNLLKQATADGITTVFNPCNASTPIGTGNRYFHRRPAIDWRHGVDEARVGIFSGNNAATAVIGTPESGVTGTPFRGNCAVAGTWYTGTSFPAQYRNTFFQADLVGQWLKCVTINFTDVVTKVENFGSGFSNLVSIAQNPLDGSIVTVEMLGTGVKRIAFGGNMPPVVQMTSDKKYGPSSLAVSFTGSGSYDPNGTISSYAWNFGDPGSGANNTSTQANPSHTFTAAAGTPTKFAVTLMVTDNGGATSTDSIIISVNNTPPVVNITSPVKNSEYIIAGDTLYSCAAAVTDAEHHAGQLKYAWQTFLRHNTHEHPEVIDTTRNTGTRISRIGCNGETYYWLVELTVTDAAGLATKDSSKIYPDCPGTLPLVLRSFSVTQQGGNNIVKWATESAFQVKEFEVERSSDGRIFYPVHYEPAHHAASNSQYSFTDKSFPAGVNYYRLKMIEIGGVIRYSVTVKVSAGMLKEDLVISPNPVSGNFSIKYTASANGTVVIRISDINGKQIRSLQESVSRGQNIIYIENLPVWKPGMYLLTVQQGADIQQGKIIKAE